MKTFETFRGRGEKRVNLVLLQGDNLLVKCDTACHEKFV